MKDYFKKFIKPILTLSFLLCILGCIGVSAESPEIYTDSNDMISLTAYQSGESSISYQIEYTDKYSELTHNTDYIGILYVGLYDSNDVLVDVRILDDTGKFENISINESYTVKAFVFDRYTQQPPCERVSVVIMMNDGFTSENLYTTKYGYTLNNTIAVSEFGNLVTKAFIMDSNNDVVLYSFANSVIINNPTEKMLNTIGIQSKRDSITFNTNDIDVMAAMEVVSLTIGQAIQFDAIGNYIYSITLPADNSEFTFIGNSESASYNDTTGIFSIQEGSYTIDDNDIIFNIGDGDDTYKFGDAVFYDSANMNCWAGRGNNLIDYSGSAAAYSFSDGNDIRYIVVVYNFDNTNKPNVELNTVSGYVTDVAVYISLWGTDVLALKLDNGQRYEVAQVFTIKNPTDTILQTIGQSGDNVTIDCNDLHGYDGNIILDELLGKYITLEHTANSIRYITIN